MLHNGLLEPCRVPVTTYHERHQMIEGDEWKVETVQGWRFLRRPDWWYITNIPVGAFLAKVPGIFVGAADPSNSRWKPLPWSVVLANGHRWGLDADLADDLLGQDKVERTPMYRAARMLVPEPAYTFSPAFVERDVPDAGVRRGDVLVYAYSRKHRPTTVTYSELGMDEYEALRLALDAEPHILTNLSPLSGSYRTVPDFLKNRRGWGRSLRTWYSRLLVVPGIYEPVSEPIDAADDAGAIETLLAQAVAHV